jgi:hypothetical protein
VDSCAATISEVVGEIQIQNNFRRARITTNVQKPMEKATRIF